MSEKFKLEKVFDSSDMPEDVLDALYSRYRHGNESYVKVYIFDERFCIGIKEGFKKPSWLDKFDVICPENIVFQHIEDGLIWCHDKEHDKVAYWLQQNGAGMGEEVLVHIW